MTAIVGAAAARRGMQSKFSTMRMKSLPLAKGWLDAGALSYRVFRYVTQSRLLRVY